MPFDRQQPHNDLPLLPPTIELETKAVLKQVIAARTALAELTGAAKLLPNQGVLIQAIGLHEAKLSSEIENIVTTHDDLYRGFANDGEGASPQTKEVLRYKDAPFAWHPLGQPGHGRNHLQPTRRRSGHSRQAGECGALHQRAV